MLSQSSAAADFDVALQTYSMVEHCVSEHCWNDVKQSTLMSLICCKDCSLVVSVAAAAAADDDDDCSLAASFHDCYIQMCLWNYSKSTFIAVVRLLLYGFTVDGLLG